MKQARHLIPLLAIVLGWGQNVQVMGELRSGATHTSEESPEPLITLGDLKRLLANRPDYQAHFKETFSSSLLTEPLTTSGTLVFSPPSRFEKHVTAPYKETYVIDGETVQFDSSQTGAHETISLNELPALRGLLFGLRAALTGKFDTLHDVFRLTLEGTERRWRLTLEPQDDSVAEILTFLSISGHHNLIKAITIREPNGDESVMVIDEHLP